MGCNIHSLPIVVNESVLHVQIIFEHTKQMCSLIFMEAIAEMKLAK